MFKTEENSYLIQQNNNILLKNTNIHGSFFYLFKIKKNMIHQILDDSCTQNMNKCLQNLCKITHFSYTLKYITILNNTLE
jgi:hypothetical protein